jgi:hypothetical protein
MSRTSQSTKEKNHVVTKRAGINKTILVLVNEYVYKNTVLTIILCVIHFSHHSSGRLMEIRHSIQSIRTIVLLLRTTIIYGNRL